MSGPPEDFRESEAYRRGVERAEAALALGVEDAKALGDKKGEWSEAQLNERLTWDKPT